MAQVRRGRTHRSDHVEIAPGGWICPAWDEGGRRYAFYVGAVFVWDETSALFEKTELRPPWERPRMERGGSDF